MNFYNEAHIIIYLVIFQFQSIFLYWFAGVVAGSAVSVFGARKIDGLIGRAGKKGYGFLAPIPAALLGAASPVCMYGTIPLIAVLGRKGVPQYLLAAFMVSSILINPNLFVFSFALGAPLAVARLALSLMAGISAGVLVKLFFKKRGLFNFDGFEEPVKKEDG